VNHSNHNHEIFGKNAEVLTFKQVVHTVTIGLLKVTQNLSSVHSQTTILLNTT